MRLWLVTLALGSAVAVAKPSVVLSGPQPITKFVSKELSKKYAVTIASSPVSAMPTAKEVRDVTAPNKAIALVLCSQGGAFLTLQVLSGHDGTPLDTVSVKGTVKKLPRAMPKSELAALVFAIGQGKAPGAAVKEPEPVKEEPKKEEPKKEEPKKEEPRKEEPKKEAPKKEEPKKEEPRKEEPKKEPSEPMASSIGGGGGNLVAVRLGVGVGGFNRSFQWQGNPSPALATANQPFSGDISVDASWYPGAHFTSNFLANIGAFFTGDWGMGMVSRVQESRFAHSAARLKFGALVRLPIGDRFALHAHLGYAREELTTSYNAINDGSARPNIPDVLFNGFRGGLGLRLRIFGTFEIDALGGFMAVSGKGELGSARYFPAATAIAIDAGGGLSAQIAPHLRMRGGVEWQRFFITLNAADDATFYAKTASDQYITATVRLEWAM
ncbi:MAG: hypothetical protein U0228_04755 [Myxococcaceae bacterium]